MGMFILLAKREEPPEMMNSPVIPVGVALIAFGLVCLAGLFFGASTSDKTVSGVASVLFLGTGLSMLRRWPGWRIYLGLIAWCLIGIAALYTLSLLIELLDGLFKSWQTRTSPFELLDKGGTVLWAFALGYFLLWVKRRERSLDDPS